MNKCKNCKYYRPIKGKAHRGECVHSARKDGELVYYFGSLKDTDYCALFDKKEVQNDD